MDNITSIDSAKDSMLDLLYLCINDINEDGEIPEIGFIMTPNNYYVVGLSEDELIAMLEKLKTAFILEQLGEI